VDQFRGAKAISATLEVLQEYGLNEEQARCAVFDMQRKGVVMMLTDSMIEMANQHDILTDMGQT
jgi:hypothetical protein